MNARPEGPLLLCWDGSENAKHAIESAAGVLAPRPAVVLTVWEPILGVGAFAWSGMTATMVDSVKLDQAAAEDGARIAGRGVRIAQDAGLEAKPVAVAATGPVWKTIIDMADCHDAAAIVMGSRGLTGFRSMLMGSVSAAVVHHADRPTLVISQPVAP